MNKFEEILKPIAELLEQKNKAYGNSFDKLRERYGPAAFYIRIADKMGRIENLDNNPDLCCGDESIIDTLNDIIGYCTLEIAYRQQYNSNTVGGK